MNIFSNVGHNSSFSIKYNTVIRHFNLWIRDTPVKIGLIKNEGIKHNLEMAKIARQIILYL